MNDLIPTNQSHTLVQKDEFSGRLEIYRQGHPFRPKYIGMHNPYTGQTIQTETDYDDYLREYVFHTVCDEAYHRVYREAFRRKVRSFTTTCAALILVFALFLFCWFIPRVKSDSYADGYAAGIDYTSSNSVNPPSSSASKSIPLPEKPKEPEEVVSGSTIVYVTDTGKKYHRSGCQYLSYSSNEVSLSKAISRGYTPCLKCRPPRLE